MLALLRRVLGIHIRITSEAALTAARDHCTAHGWHWGEPVHIRLGLRDYTIITQCDMRGGGKIFLGVDGENGEVSSSGPVPR